VSEIERGNSALYVFENVDGSCRSIYIYAYVCTNLPCGVRCAFVLFSWFCVFYCTCVCVYAYLASFGGVGASSMTIKSCDAFIAVVLRGINEEKTGYLRLVRFTTTYP
jgi:hypothetical protein